MLTFHFQPKPPWDSTQKGTQVQKHICDHKNKLVKTESDHAPPPQPLHPILGKIVWGLEAELTESGTESSVVKEDEQVGIMKA